MNDANLRTIGTAETTGSMKIAHGDKSMDKERLDVLLVNQGFCSSREKAKAQIKAGHVRVAGKTVTKPGEKVDPTQEIQVTEKEKYVSRGGYKLERGIQSFSLKLQGMTCMDVGASTGGFTDCMLQQGAQKVVAVDVGRCQLADVLREDPRVVSFEETNIKDLSPEQILEKMDFISVDVSFISLEKVLPFVHSFLKENGQVLALIKPQFEAGRAALTKKGVVKNDNIRRKVLANLFERIPRLNFDVLGVDFSPIKGPEGNFEFLILLKKKNSPGGCLCGDPDTLAKTVMEQARRELP